MFGSWKVFGKEQKLLIYHIWFYYRKYERKLNIIKIIKKIVY